MIRTAQPFGREVRRRSNSRGARVENITRAPDQISYELRIDKLESEVALLESLVLAIGEAAHDTLQQEVAHTYDEGDRDDVDKI